MRNKRGQTQWEIIGWVIAAVVLVIVVLAFSGAFGNISDLFGRFPKLDVAAKTCSTYAAGNLVNNYCYVPNKVEINGKAQYGTCEWLGTQSVVFDKMPANTCETYAANIETIRSQFCTNQKLKAGKDLVDGVLCPTANANTAKTCDGLGGKPVSPAVGTTTAVCPSGKTLLSGASDITSPVICCTK